MIITGTDLRIMRLRAGKTTVQMAEFASVKTRKTYENWEKNVGSPSMNQFLAMSMACGFKPAELIKMYIERDNSDAEIDLMSASEGA
ncbi:helix-turn-helix domain-containing protein [Planctobacterium marinum]|uniref:helix-turn-helix domain-containing protein n=1 Tax=Planctobacterium marinum TaxID=1631968 RepID=UPI001E3F5F66|nr:helix-turn-helix transcriptional regulator [Planctobacterium marinum]MCC2607301.1 helix-turn-helix domain-containing protein [Planctobacterium marinum]